MAEKKHQLTALGIAYEAVIKLGYTHSKLARLDSSINYPTLRNIRDGKEMKNGLWGRRSRQPAYRDEKHH